MLRCGIRQGGESLAQGMRQAEHLACPVLMARGLALVILALTATTSQARDLTLAEAERLFAQRSRELQQARRALEGAEADRLSAAARPNPNVYLNATQLGSLYPQGYDASRLDRRLDIVVGINQVFERGDKRELRMSAAEANAQASRNELSDVRRVQTIALHAAYYDLVLAQEKQRIVEQTVAAFAKTLDAMALRLKAGDVARADVARVRVDALRADNDARAVRAERDRAQVALAYLIGLETVARELVASDGWTAVEDAPMADVGRIVEGRPDVQAAQARLRATENRRELARALLTRDVSGQVQIERAPWNPLANPTSANTLGFGISFPLFTNYAYEGEIRRAETELEAAKENLERVRAQALGEIGRARADLESARDRMRRYRESLLNEASKAAAAAEFAYQRGAIGVMDLLDSRRQLYGTQIDASVAQAEYARALAAWRASQTTVQMLGDK